MRFKGNPDQYASARVTELSYVPEERRKLALEQALPEQLGTELRALREAFEEVADKKQAFCEEHGAAHPELIEELAAKRDAYFFQIRAYSKQEAYKLFFAPITRKNISMEIPPPPKGKRAAGHTIPIASSSLVSIYPGNYPEYQAFLDEHNALHRLPESLSSKGGMMITPPRFDLQKHVTLLEKMNAQHAYWRNAPVVDLHTTRSDVFRLLSHFDPDYTAFVRDHGGEIVGVVDKEKAKKMSNTSKVRDFLSTDFKTEDLRDIEPLAALAKMVRDNVDYLVHFDEDGTPKMMTQTDASWYSRHDPFRIDKQSNRGLGFVSYIGVRSQDQAMAEMDALYRKGQRRFMIETAHMHRTDTIYNVLAEARERFPDCFIATGTTSTAKGVLEMSTFADAVKVIIAGGTICDSNEVAVQPGEVETIRRCGAAAQGIVSLIIDTLSNRKQLATKLGTQECIAVQGGGSIAVRRDSANPIGMIDGNPYKRVDGEAGLEALLRGMVGAPRTLEDIINEKLGYHTEGRTDRWKRKRILDTLAQFFNELMNAPPSTHSYTGHVDLASFQGNKPDECAVVERVYEEPREKADDELYSGLRPEEADIFDSVANYKKRKNGGH